MRILLRAARAAGLLLLLIVAFYARSRTEAAGGSTVTLLTEAGTQELALEDYLPGTVAAEMPALFEPEALKAQAVAARTFVLSRTGYHGEADVCSDSACCLGWKSEDELRTFWGAAFDENWAKIRAACQATEGQILTWEGEPAVAAFHASSAGYTEAAGALWGDLPYLTVVESPETAALVPNYVTEARYACAIFAATLDLPDQGDPAQWLGALTRDDSGRVASAQIQDRVFTGAQLRSAFGLRSAAFTLVWDGDDFVFTVTGSGHGVGMSQYGAQAYALAGWTYREILAHYYPGTALTETD